MQLAHELGDINIMESLLASDCGYDTSTVGSRHRSYSSLTMHITTSMNNIPSSIIVTADRKESFISQLTCSTVQDDIITTSFNQISIVSTNTNSEASTKSSYKHHGIVNESSDISITSTHSKAEKTGITRRIRKAGSRIMSVFLPNQYPKSKQNQMHKRNSSISSLV